MIDLSAIARRRAEEQVRTAFKFSDPIWKRPSPKLAGVEDGVPLSCVCGDCKVCLNREYMRRWRGGKLEKRHCTQCNRKLGPSNRSGWCGKCAQIRPGQFKAWQRSVFFDGGGI